MKLLTSLCAAVALLTILSPAGAGELKSGLQKGKFIDAFDVVKCAGAPNDGVAIGEELCYRCKYDSRPMVMVFARTSDEKLAALAKQLDESVAKNSAKKLSAFVNLVGEDRDELEANAKELGETNKLENVPVVVPVEYENGPANYGINPEADVTVILAAGGKVLANHALAEGELNDDAVKAILADVPKLLK